MNYLFVAAVLPVILLCYYIYKKDVNKEPMSLLIKIFSFGLLTFIPILILEIAMNSIFPVNSLEPFYIVFLQVFIGIAFIEEFFKWMVTKQFGYHNHEFDEIYDIIVYAVFASLGFACIENVLYVFENGILVALMRSFLSIPAHTYMGIMMGYFLSKTKIANINQNQGAYYRNMILSLLIPALIHTLYDALLLKGTNTTFYLFIILHVVMIIVCISMINRMSKIQMKLNQNIASGMIMSDSQGHIQYPNSFKKMNYCPICGKKIEGYHFCPSCGFQIQS